MTPDDSLELQLQSAPAKIADARKAAEAFAGQHGFDENAVGDIGLCVNEAIANIIRHAYKGATDRPIQLKIAMQADVLHVDLRDWGSGVVPPINRPDHDPPSENTLTPGGVGMPCLKLLLDKIEFVPQSDGMLLKMTRRLHPAEKETSEATQGGSNDGA